MAIEIQLLFSCKQHIPRLAALWYEGIGKQWVPNASIEHAKKKLTEYLNDEHLPLTLVATHNKQPIGMASLRINDGIQPGLTPWLGGLVVDPAFQHCKIGKRLIDAIKQKSFAMGFKKVYLLAFDPTIPTWYTKLGWKSIGTDLLFGHSVVVMEVALGAESP